MALSKKNQDRITRHYTDRRAELLQGTLIRSGAGRSAEIQESNYLEIHKDLTTLGLSNLPATVAEAAALLGAVLGRTVEIQAPPNDNGAARKLAALQRDSSTVQHVIAGVDVRLDIDQLKHQHKTLPIGTRHKGGGNRFDNTCDETWHQTVTMAHMAAWANTLGVMPEGQQTFHGQMVPVMQVHYEGYCLQAGGQKYVLFHCYPSDGSPLLGPRG